MCRMTDSSARAGTDEGITYLGIMSICPGDLIAIHICPPCTYKAGAIIYSQCGGRECNFINVPRCMILTDAYELSARLIIKHQIYDMGAKW